MKTNEKKSDNSAYCTYCSINNNCIMFTHSIGIVTVIGQPNADNERRIQASRVRTKVVVGCCVSVTASCRLRLTNMQIQYYYCCYYQI